MYRPLPSKWTLQLINFHHRSIKTTPSVLGKWTLQHKTFPQCIDHSPTNRAKHQGSERKFVLPKCDVTAEATFRMPGVTAPVNAKLAQVPTVEIDSQGVFKYILCKIYEGNNMQDCKLIVRGTAVALFHADIYDTLDANLETEGINCECVGGGKIKHDPEKRSIEIFGKSQAYGKANHATTAKLLEDAFAAYSITWSD